MSIKKKEVRICDYCKSELDEDYVSIHDMPNEGCSELYYKNKSYCFGDSDFCDLSCFIKDIRGKVDE